MQVLAAQETAGKEEKKSFLRNVKLFEHLHDVSLSKLAEVLTLVTFSAGSRIFKQGEVGNSFYLIKSGIVSICQATSSFSNATSEIAKLGPGKYFGELALMEDEPRKASAVAVDSVVCFVLDRFNFNNTLGEFKEALDENIGVAVLQKVIVTKI